jgi:N-acetylglucosaminyl-diphospho-decaprenol L-rhamnosyltransferase
VIVTHNRRDVLLRTLVCLRFSAPRASEVWVVVNGSTDGTAAALQDDFPEVNVITLERNEGVGARSRAFDRTRGRYVVLLDDDSYPVGDTVQRSVAILDREPELGALGGRVLLPMAGKRPARFPAW